MVFGLYPSLQTTCTDWKTGNRMLFGLIHSISAHIMSLWSDISLICAWGCASHLDLENWLINGCFFLSFLLTGDSQFIGGHSIFSQKHPMNKQMMIRHTNERQAREEKKIIFGNNTFCSSPLLPFSTFVLTWGNQKACFCRQCKTYFKSMFAGNMGKLLPLRSFAFL